MPERGKRREVQLVLVYRYCRNSFKYSEPIHHLLGPHSMPHVPKPECEPVAFKAGKMDVRDHMNTNTDPAAVRHQTKRASSPEYRKTVTYLM